MTYTISKQITIRDDEDGWESIFTTDEYGTVCVQTNDGPTCQFMYIPKDCIQPFIDVLEQFK